MSDLNYLDFDLILEGGEDAYRSRVLNSPAGEAAGEFSQPFSELELENFYLRIGRPRRGVRSLDSAEMETAKTFGTRIMMCDLPDPLIIARSRSVQCRRSRLKT